MAPKIYKEIQDSEKSILAGLRMNDVYFYTDLWANLMNKAITEHSNITSRQPRNNNSNTDITLYNRTEEKLAKFELANMALRVLEGETAKLLNLNKYSVYKNVLNMVHSTKKDPYYTQMMKPDYALWELARKKVNGTEGISNAAVIKKYYCTAQFLLYAFTNGMQFLHCMDSSNGNMNRSHEKIIKWVEFCCAVYRNETIPGTKTALINENFYSYLLSLYEKNNKNLLVAMLITLCCSMECVRSVNAAVDDWTNTNLFDNTDRIINLLKDKKNQSFFAELTIGQLFNLTGMYNPQYVALGSAIHVIQDSFCHNNVIRLYEDNTDDYKTTRIMRFLSNYSKEGGTLSDYRIEIDLMPLTKPEDSTGLLSLYKKTKSGDMLLKCILEFILALQNNSYPEGIVNKIFDFPFYQSAKPKGYSESGEIAEDMKTNDMSEEDINSYLELKDYLKHPLYPIISEKSTDSIISDFKSITGFVFGDADDILTGMVDLFLSGSGKTYTNETLNKLAEKHQSTQYYINCVQNIVKSALINGTISIESKANGEYIIKNDGSLNTYFENLNRPTFNNLLEDGKNGLLLAVDSTHGITIDVKIKQYDRERNTYIGVIAFDIYDHFGLDIRDALFEEFSLKELAIHFASCFRAWYMLQHRKKYKGQYKPFITDMIIEKEFEVIADNPVCIYSSLENEDKKIDDIKSKDLSKEEIPKIDPELGKMLQLPNNGAKQLHEKIYDYIKSYIAKLPVQDSELHTDLVTRDINSHFKNGNGLPYSNPYLTSYAQKKDNQINNYISNVKELILTALQGHNGDLSALCADTSLIDELKKLEGYKSTDWGGISLEVKEWDVSICITGHKTGDSHFKGNLQFAFSTDYAINEKVRQLYYITDTKISPDDTGNAPALNAWYILQRCNDFPKNMYKPFKLNIYIDSSLEY